MPISHEVDISSLLGIPTLGAPQFNISAVGLGSGVIGLAGNTSGVATITAPAVAGTSTNALTISNVLSVPIGSASSPGYGFSGNSNHPGIYNINTGTSALVFCGGDNALLTVNWVTNGSVASVSGGVHGWVSSATDSTNVLDTGISRLGAASVAIGNGNAGDFTGALKLTTLTLQGKVGTYNAIATVSQGVPAEYATVDLTAQSAAIGATTLYAVPATGAGMYRISWSATITTVDGAASVLGGTNGFQVVYTSPTDSVVKTTVPGNSVTSAANTTGTAVGGCEVVYAKASTNIQYKYDYTSTTPGQMIYELHIKCEAL